MKSKDLIAALQKEDPSGELEVIIGSKTAIYFVEKQPGYYDGSYMKLIQNESPYYNITGFHCTREGHKVRLHLVDIEDILWDLKNPTIEMHPSLGEYNISELKNYIEKIKKERSEY